MASTQPAHRWTYADLYRLPDDGRRYEIIEGVCYEMPPPNAGHATAVMNLLLFVLGPVVQDRGGRLFTARSTSSSPAPTRCNPTCSCSSPSNCISSADAASKARRR